jgi:beta-galactosidase GanA
MERSINDAIISRTLDNEDSYVVVVNFGSNAETVNVKETFSEVPDEITMLLLSINSGHMAG